MKLAITGHRPEKLPQNLNVLENKVEEVLVSLEPEKVYVGMAAGIDLMVAELCAKNNLPYVACKPWIGHKARAGSEQLYNFIIDNAFEVVNVMPVVGYPGPGAYEKRNRYMVDNADTVLSVWDGGESGGTWRATSYAFKTRKVVYQVHPKTLQVTEHGFPSLFS